jgi:exosome complex exonuclease RRP6
MMTYTRERYDYQEGSGVDGWRKLLLNNKGPHLHSNLQLTVFKRLHQWRDGVARQEDESTGYVIPNRALINLAASLPNSMQAVVAACHPVPPLVQVYAEDVAYIVAKTRKELLEEAEKAEITAAKAIHGQEETL